MIACGIYTARLHARYLVHHVDRVVLSEQLAAPLDRPPILSAWAEHALHLGVVLEEDKRQVLRRGEAAAELGRRVAHHEAQVVPSSHRQHELSAHLAQRLLAALALFYLHLTAKVEAAKVEARVRSGRESSWSGTSTTKRFQSMILSPEYEK